MRRDRWLALLAGALVLRFALALGLGLSQVVPHDGWYWENKDQLQYYAFGDALLHGAISPIYTFMGYGVLIAPLLVGTHFVLQAIPQVALVQLALAIPAAWLLFRAGERLLNRRAAAIGTALWLTAPVWLTPIWFHSYSPTFDMAPWWLGFQISVDYGIGLLAIAALALAAGARDDAGAWRGAAIGVVSGLAVLAKPSNAALVAVTVVALAAWRRRRAAVAALLVPALVAAPQFVLDWRISGRPFHFQYLGVWPLGSKPQAAIGYVPRTFGKLFLLNYTGPLLGLALVAALVVTWRRFPAARALVVAQVVLYALGFSVLYYSISSNMLRFMTAALPALCLACGGALARGGESACSPARPIRAAGRGVVVLAVAGAIALAVFTGVAAWRPVLPVVASLRPTVARAARPGWVTIVWPPAHATGIRLAYRVTRGDRLIWGGVRTRIRDRAGRRRPAYRVYVQPSATPRAIPTGTHAFAVSPPVRPR